MDKEYYISFETIFYIIKLIVWIIAVFSLVFLKDLFTNYFIEYPKLSAVITWALLIVFALNFVPKPEKEKETL